MNAPLTVGELVALLREYPDHAEVVPELDTSTVEELQICGEECDCPQTLTAHEVAQYTELEFPPRLTASTSPSFGLRVFLPVAVWEP